MPERVTGPATQGDALEALIEPRHIVVVGASERPGHFANQPLANLARHGFTGRVSAVNPKHRDIGGVPSYPLLADLPDLPDLAVVVTRPEIAVDAVSDCAALGVRAAVVVASGFAEQRDEAGASLQEALLEAAAGRTRVLGPNTLGIANVNAGIVSSASGNFPDQPLKGGIALVSQSGGCSFTIVNRAWRLGVGIGHVAVAGNEADVTIPELATAYLARDDVRTVLCYMEAVRDPEGLRRLGQAAAAAGKPVFVMKAGSTEAGQLAAAAHTGALAAPDRVAGAALAQWGLPRAESFDELIAAGALAERFAPAGPGGVGVYAQGGGMAVVMADLLSRTGLRPAVLSEATVARIKALMPDTAPGNPFDSGGQFLSKGAGVLVEALDAFTADPAIEAVVYILMPVVGHRVSVYTDAIATPRAVDKPAAVLHYGGGELTGETTRRLRAAGMLVLDPPEPSMAGVRLWLQAGDARPVRAADDTDARRRATARALLEEWRHLPTAHEHLTMSLLELYGIPCPRRRVARTAEEAAAAAAALGAPVAMKVLSAGIPHRSDFGGVLLGVPADAAATAFGTLCRRAAGAHATAILDGVLVSEMAPPGHELIAGVQDDPVFGPTVLLGLGGVLAELLDDVAIRVAPIDADEGLRMIGALRAAPALTGYRGAAAVDVDRLADLLVRLSELAVDARGLLRSVDLNPVLAGPGSVMVADCLAVPVGPGRAGA